MLFRHQEKASPRERTANETQPEPSSTLYTRHQSPSRRPVLRTAHHLLSDARFSCMWAQRNLTLVSPCFMFGYLLIQNTYLCLSHQYFLLKKSQGLFVWSHFSDCTTNSSCTLKCRKRCRADCDASWFGRELRFNPPHTANTESEDHEM